MSSSLFCDGACSGNGTGKSKGGWAWAWWAGSVTGTPTVARAEPLETPPTATNQRAELTALLEAIRWWSASPADCGSGGGPVTIYTDSMYAMNCCTVWGPAWKRRGWTRSSGEPLQNLDLIIPLVDLWRPEWKIVHVRGHQSGSSPLFFGNNWVDKAAVFAGGGESITIDNRHLLGIASTSKTKAKTAEQRRSVTAIPIAKTDDIRKWFS